MSHHTIAVAAALALFAAAAGAVDANRAGQAELESVKGVGTSLSARILEARKAGPFKDWADFMARVKGVGESSAARLSEAGLTVGGAAYPGSAPVHRD